MVDMLTIIDPSGKKTEVPRQLFQALHSAARALYKQAMQTYDHTKEAATYLIVLNTAIDVGHEVLGTDRPSADHYVHLVNGITAMQKEHAEAILKKEGLLE